MLFRIAIILILGTLPGFAQHLYSPSADLKLVFSLTPAGEPQYELSYKKKEVIKKSKLGFDLKGQPPLTQNFIVAAVDSNTVDTSWQPVWGEVKTIRDHHKEMSVTLRQKETDRILVIRFRLFNDGLGFRYEFPEQKNLAHFTIINEKTQFALTGDHKTFWIPGDYETNEYFYYTSKLTEANSKNGEGITEIATRVIIPNAVQTPLMMKSDNGLYINIHEAALVHYPAMNLEVDRKNLVLSSHLVPDGVGNKAYLQTPAKTPWRTVLVSDQATDILNSKTILNLNEPGPTTDTDWIKPMKYVGIWWEMHVGRSTWFYSDATNLTLKGTDWKNLKPGGKHGATTENTKRYIDFAAKHGFDGVLIEGWNIGWEDWFGQWKEEVFDFVTPYPDFNVEELQQYAASKNVKLIMHHETSGSVTNYERRMDEAFRFMKKYNYPAVKTGYVGYIIPRGEHHDSQWMIDHYNRVAEKTRDYKIMLNAHEPVRPTGLHRTYPHWLACEAARGNEFNAWSIGNPPEHETILPFTRLMGGPMDYTPGIFEVKMSFYNAERPFQNASANEYQVHTTLTKQLALYVTMYSPLQMAADLPENYERYADAFQFIKDVAIDWDDTKVINAEPGDFITIARKAKGSDAWFLGSITDENPRNLSASLNFLDASKKYVATVYSDAPSAHWKENPKAYEIKKYVVDAKTILNLKLAAGGGTAIHFAPATVQEIKSIKKYTGK
jgi:hypothetical protein